MQVCLLQIRLDLHVAVQLSVIFGGNRSICVKKGKGVESSI